ncbi:MAG: GNAT family N-acetyltransferase, partial [Sphingobacteriales bacterium]
MKIVPVKDNKSKKEFLDVVATVYAGDKNWIRPLDSDIEKVFDAKANPFFEHGKCTR